MSLSYDWIGEFSYIQFPEIHEFDDDLITYGGELSPDFLLSAYSQGIFPWFSDDQPILWWSLDPRFVVFPENLHVSKTMHKLLKKTSYTRTLDKAFPEVIRACASAFRPDQHGTWITSDMIDAYIKLHMLGFAHSAELWDGTTLVGGFYGVSLGNAFFGESMFSRVNDGSKLAFIPFVWLLQEEGFVFVDCQMETPHLKSMGGEEIPRKKYLTLLQRALEAPTRRGNWGSLYTNYPETDHWNRFFHADSLLRSE